VDEFLNIYRFLRWKNQGCEGEGAHNHLGQIGKVIKAACGPCKSIPKTTGNRSFQAASTGIGDHLRAPNTNAFWHSPQFIPELFHNLPYPMSPLKDFNFQVCSISKKKVNEFELLTGVLGKHAERRVFSACLISG
jgi:hypothetical protein